MSMLTVWTLWEIMSVTVQQGTLEMEHTAQVNAVFLLESANKYSARLC